MRLRLAAAVALLVPLAGCDAPDRFSCAALNARQADDGARTCVASGQVLGDEIVPHSGSVAAVSLGGRALTPDDRLTSTAAAFPDGVRLTIQPWGVSWGDAGGITRRDSVGRVGGIAVSASGRTAVALADGRLLLGARDGDATAEGRVAAGFRAIGGIEVPETIRLAWAPDGAWLAGVGSDGVLMVWDGATARALWTAPLDTTVYALGTDGAHVAVGQADRSVTVWTADGDRAARWALPRNAQDFGFDDAHLAVWIGDRYTTRRVDAATARSTQPANQISQSATGDVTVGVTEPPQVVVWRLPTAGS